MSLKLSLWTMKMRTCNSLLVLMMRLRMKMRMILTMVETMKVSWMKWLNLTERRERSPLTELKRTGDPSTISQPRSAPR